MRGGEAIVRPTLWLSKARTYLAAMGTASKKHHTVPQFLLRNFSIDEAGKRIFVFDKQTDRSYPSSIGDAAENNFNTVEFESGRRLNFEPLFQDVDARSAGLAKRLVRNRSLAGLTPSDLHAVVDLLAVQLLRTKMSRTSIVTLAHGMRDMIEAMGHKADEDPYLALPTERDVRLGTVRAFFKRDATWASLSDKHPVLFEPAEDGRFLISDHPIVMANAFAYGDLGLQSPGVQIYLPLSPTLCLGLLCPTYLRRLRYVEDPAFPVDDARRTRFRSLRDGIMNGSVAVCPPADTRALNQNQIATSSRYLYAPTDDFDLARTMLNAHPDLRQVDTLVHMGEMGCGPAARANMPDGLHLVFVGELDHAMLAIESVDPQGEGITASTSDSVGLESLLRLGPLVEARLFDNGQVLRGMRDIQIEILERGALTRFRIVPRVDALRSLFAKLDKDVDAGLAPPDYV